MNSKVKYLSSILAPISLGELIDKITILEIKQIHMTGIKLKNIDKELKLLKNIIQHKNLEIDIDLINNLFYCVFVFKTIVINSQRKF